MVASLLSKLKKLNSERLTIRLGLTVFIIWLQMYAHSDWLLSGHYFIVMTGHYEMFSRLDGFF